MTRVRRSSAALGSDAWVSRTSVQSGAATVRTSQPPSADAAGRPECDRHFVLPFLRVSKAPRDRLDRTIRVVAGPRGGHCPCAVSAQLDAARGVVHLEHANGGADARSPVTQLGAQVGEPVQVRFRHSQLPDNHERTSVPACLLEEHHAGQVYGPLELNIDFDLRVHATRSRTPVAVPAGTVPRRGRPSGITPVPD